MFYKIYLQNYQECFPHVIAGSLRVLPNPLGGLRSLEVGKIDTFWTGIDHLQFDLQQLSTFLVQLTGINSIYQRSTLDETDEPWVPIYAHPLGKFHYGVYVSLAEELERKLEEGKCHSC